MMLRRGREGSAGLLGGDAALKESQDDGFEEWQDPGHQKTLRGAKPREDDIRVYDLAQALASPTAGDECFRQVVESIVDSVIIHRHGRIVYANPAAVAIVGGGLVDDITGLAPLDFVAPEDRQKVGDVILHVADHGGASEIVGYTGIGLDGRCHDIETIAVRTTSQEGAAILNVCRDVTERNRTETALRDSEARFRTFAEHSPGATVGICERRIVIANRAAARLFGVDNADDLIGKDVLRFCGDAMQNWAKRSIAVLEQGEAVPRQLRGRLCRPNGTSIDAEWTSIPFIFGGKPAAYVILRDVTERLKTEERHRYLASHDPLTGLPNRLEFQHRLKAMAEQAGSTRTRFAIHYLDLDYFKNINDSLGHQIGDKLLQFVAARLKRTVRSSDLVARLGGDEFAVLQTDADSSFSPRYLAEKLQHAIEQPYTVGDHLLHSSATIGIAVFPDHGDDPDHLLRRADLALYQAKDQGRNAISFFSEDLDIRVQERDSLVTQLIRAEARGEFDIHFQPIASLCSGRIDAVEALLRWHHPDRGLLVADDFIHAVEASREAQRIGAWVLRKACDHAKSWDRHDIGNVRVAVNLSMPLLQRPDLVDLVRSSLDDVGLAPSRLELELTERIIITAGAAGIVPKLLKLHDMGVRIALDDFGTGFSSLALLRDLPVDRIKIDRSFIAGFGSNADDTAIVRAVTNLGRSMNKRVTAEGVECSTTLELLRNEGCHEIQGFHLARPMPAGELVDFLMRSGPKKMSAATDTTPSPDRL